MPASDIRPPIMCQQQYAIIQKGQRNKSKGWVSQYKRNKRKKCASATCMYPSLKSGNAEYSCQSPKASVIQYANPDENAAFDPITEDQVDVAIYADNIVRPFNVFVNS